MNICLIYHSESGKTKSFAEIIRKNLEKKGHKVTDHQLISLAPVKKASVREHQEISFKELPSLDGFDAILFGGPVWAFGPSPVVVAAIREIKPKGKKCACFATMSFPFRWMGGSSALRYMEKELKAKDALVIPGVVCTNATKDIVAMREVRASDLIASL